MEVEWRGHDEGHQPKQMQALLKGEIPEKYQPFFPQKMGTIEWSLGIDSNIS